MALARRRILEISCLTDVGHRLRGRVLLVGPGVGLCGNIKVAMPIASRSMVWRSLAKPRMDANVSCVGSPWSSRGWSPDEWDKESSRERVVVFASKVAE